MAKHWNPEALKPGSRNALQVELEGYASGIRVEIPFHVLVGAKSGPRILLIAGVHGDEYEGVAALHDVVDELDPQTLTGSVVIVPVANPQAFHAGTRRNPVDFGDLNRAFPGDPLGTITQRLAAVLFEEFVLGSDAFLSLHGWSKEATVIPYAEYPLGEGQVVERSKAAALHLGMEYLHPYVWPAGVLGDAATRHGIAAVETEVGGMGTITAEGQRITRSIILRFLEFWGVISGTAPPKSAGLRQKIVDHDDIFAGRSGLFRRTVEIGQPVSQGETLGRTFALEGRCVEELFAPCTGVVAILRMNSSVQPGDRLIQVFRET
jgi:N2-acetyl-L-2,4-diaminobutanoate deacetylase